MINSLIEKMIFYPERTFQVQPGYFSLNYEDISLNTRDNILIHGWFFSSDGPETVLFLHGNAGNIADRLDNIYRFVKLGFSVFIIDYRGYGKSGGSPSEAGTYLDARAAWHWLQENERLNGDKIVLFGRSLGGAVAIELATRYKPYRLIVESSFTSVKEMGHKLFPFIPRALIPDIYPSIDRIGSVQCPILITHGTNDTLIPYSYGEKLYDKASEPKYFYPIKNADHNNTYIIGGNEYFNKFLHFIKEG